MAAHSCWEAMNKHTEILVNHSPGVSGGTENSAFSGNVPRCAGLFKASFSQGGHFSHTFFFPPCTAFESPKAQMHRAPLLSSGLTARPMNVRGKRCGDDRQHSGDAKIDALAGDGQHRSRR